MVCRGGGKGLNECFCGPSWLRSPSGGHLQLSDVEGGGRGPLPGLCSDSLLFCIATLALSLDI